MSFAFLEMAQYLKQIVFCNSPDRNTQKKGGSSSNLIQLILCMNLHWPKNSLLVDKLEKIIGKFHKKLKPGEIRTH